MKIKLRASGKKVSVPSSPSALNGRADGVASPYMPGDSTPVNSHRGFAGAAQGTMMVGPAPTNIGKYTPPPKNPIWTNIPTSIKPTPLLGGQPFKKCSECGD